MFFFQKTITELSVTWKYRKKTTRFVTTKLTKKKKHYVFFFKWNFFLLYRSKIKISKVLLFSGTHFHYWPFPFGSYIWYTERRWLPLLQKSRKLPKKNLRVSEQKDQKNTCPAFFAIKYFCFFAFFHVFHEYFHVYR